jgi:hypothetical protein
VSWLESLPREEFFKSRSYGGHDWSFYANPVAAMWQHDAEHAEEVAAWRRAEGMEATVGSKAVLLAALDAARHELLVAAALVQESERDTRAVCGHWTLKDLLGHIADWEAFGSEGLDHMAAGQPPIVELIEDIDAWNEEHVLARRAEPVEEVEAHLDLVRQVLRTVLERMSQEDLALVFPVPWGGESTPYYWVSIYVDHDREHARDIEAEFLNVP